MSEPGVLAILERAAHVTPAEASALGAEVRRRPDLIALAGMVLNDHQRWLNEWAMFDHWAHPSDEMREARRRIAAALGVPPPPTAGDLEPDDGSLRWGAATAAAWAVLASGAVRFSVGAPTLLGVPWQQVLGARKAG